MKLKDCISNGVLKIEHKTRQKAELIKLDCGKHSKVRFPSEGNHCFKCAKKLHKPWNYKGNYALNTRTNVPSKRTVKDNAKRGLDQFANLRG